MPLSKNISTKARELSSVAYKLSVADRKWLIKAIRDGLKMEGLNECKEKVARYIQIMEDIKGKRLYQRDKSRFDKFAWSVIAWQLRNDGFTCDTIGGAMGCRLHTIEYRILNVNKIVGMVGYKKETDLFNQFKEKIYEIQ